MAAGDDQELDTEQLLEQGDELLRSSRRLLDDLDEVIDLTEDDADVEIDAREPSGRGDR